MIHVRKAGERGHFNHGWLDTYHTFSFADYHDPNYMGFRSLRVINEDRVAPGMGFAPHSHRDMEIITYVLEGALEHKDSMGNTSVIRPGDVQRMSAGTGVTHSEFNSSKSESVHLLQIWILPSQIGLTPSYEQRTFTKDQKRNQLCLVAAGQPPKDVIKIHQNVELHVAWLEEGKQVQHSLKGNRHAWIQVSRGSIKTNNIRLKSGDGAAVSDEKVLTLVADEDESELLLFDLE